MTIFESDVAALMKCVRQCEDTLLKVCSTCVALIGAFHPVAFAHGNRTGKAMGAICLAVIGYCLSYVYFPMRVLRLKDLP